MRSSSICWLRSGAHPVEVPAGDQRRTGDRGQPVDRVEARARVEQAAVAALVLLAVVAAEVALGQCGVLLGVRGLPGGVVAVVVDRDAARGALSGREVEQLVQRVGGEVAAGRGAAEHELRDALGMPQRELLRDHPAERGSDHVAALPADDAEQRRGVVGEVRHLPDRRGRLAASEAALVVGEHAEALEQRVERAGRRPARAAAAADEEQRRALAAQFVLGAGVADLGVRHGCAPSSLLRRSVPRSPAGCARPRRTARPWRP